MDRSTPIKLISETYSADSIGQLVPTESTTSVFCNLRSVTRNEWKAAGEMGLKPSYEVTMFAYDYSGEKIVEISGKRYGVYRTYLGTNDTIELYLEEMAGVCQSASTNSQNP